ncbi:TenA family protein [Legionella bononiensis]|uniref:TenA family protein n=1 Tax=Legionella bononiensis TaxID=2793102 RepID=A0ABS1WCK5_9GAMM|nr:TenA family protein [Legionella bononiensis]MBL7478947.1 TenA family protein [Legionella bononiensis]MBL7527079.1 TenA family protein [Legionella bononiensis]MBL7562048.1 TenA family protein [Legionella bononiensis]
MSYLKYCHLFYKKKPDSSFLSRLIRLNRNSLQSIYDHPFNQELFAGTLPQEKFGQYLRDDFLYLRQFSSALQNIAKRTIKINPDLSSQLNKLAEDVINNEHTMQLQYRIHFNDFNEHQMGYSVSQYSQYLVNTSTQARVPEALCSILPCFWIYYQLGTMIQTSSIMTPHPYYEWIATYSGAEFVQVTKDLAATVNLIVGDANQMKHSELIEFFSKSVEFELDFFNEIYYPQVTAKHVIYSLGK